MSNSSKCVDNLSEIWSKKCRTKNVFSSECEFKGLKNNKLFIIAKSVEKTVKPINGLIKKFPNINCNNDLNKFILLLRQGIYQ